MECLLLLRQTTTAEIKMSDCTSLEIFIFRKQLPVTELPEERMQFTLGMYGDGDFFSMKGVVEEFFEKIGMHEKETYDPNAGKPYLHPGRQANIMYDGKVVGYLGRGTSGSCRYLRNRGTHM